MSKLIERLIQSYVVLHYYYLIDNTRGKSLDEIPVNYRQEVELKANERYVNEYLKASGDNDGL